MFSNHVRILGLPIHWQWAAFRRMTLLLSFFLFTVVLGLPAADAGRARPVETLRDRTILLRHGRIDPHERRDALRLGDRLPGGKKHVMVQFAQMPSRKDRAALRKEGIRLLKYVPNNTFWVSLDPVKLPSLENVQVAGGIGWAWVPTPEFKVAGAVYKRKFPVRSGLGDDSVSVRILFFDDVDESEAVDALRSLGKGIQVLGWASNRAMAVLSPLGAIPDIATLDAVEWIEPAERPKIPHNETAAQRIHVSVLREPPFSLDGSGITVGVWDSGAVFEHEDFDTRLTVVDDVGVSTHSTHVGGTIGGSGFGDSSAKGMAPGAFIWSYDWNWDDNEMRDAMGNGIAISNHSYGFATGWTWDGDAWIDYGDSGFGDYSSYTESWDDIVYDTELLVFKSAGNDRNDGPDWPDCEGDGSFSQDDGPEGIVSMEAENYHDHVPQGGDAWTGVSPAGHSGTGAMQALPNDGTVRRSGYESNSPRLDYSVNFTQGGTYYVWIRGIGPGRRDDTVHAGLDGEGVESARFMNGFGSNWAWSRSTSSGTATLNVTAGTHTVNVWMREDGFIVDKIVLTTSSSYVPTGEGPAESARNEGRCDGPYDSVGELGVAKNILTVGALTDSDVMSSFSSWGPADDGRTKPDLCANGIGLWSTTPNNQYGSMSGTSMSAPSAAGAAAVLREHYINIAGDEPSAATLKALMIHGAQDLGRPGPDYEFGWGLIDAAASANLMSEGLWETESIASTGSVVTYEIFLSEAQDDLKVTLVWTDPPGSPAAAQALVNDLDLVLIDPDGIEHQPWVLDKDNPATDAARGANHLDNVEQVLVTSPGAGVWTVQVSGFAVPFGPQDFTTVSDLEGVCPDSDGDGVSDCDEECPDDPNKIEPGACGCGVEDTDSDQDGTPDCNDGCPDDPNKVAPGQCGCGNPDTDSDSDGTADCNDGCPGDPDKAEPGQCGCGSPDTDSDGDGTADCSDGCPGDPDKTTPGVCGCGLADVDSDGDGTLDCDDGCPSDPDKVEPGQCGCGNPDTDSDGDGSNLCDDCDDNDAENYPGNTELCDGQDNNCDGNVDEGLTLFTFYLDADDDGFGDPANSVEACVAPEGYVTDGTDNCPDTYNPDQLDSDDNGIGDACEGDGPFQQDPGDDGIVSMEAEHYDYSVTQGGHEWVVAYPSGYLGDSAMEAWPNDGTGYYSGYESTSPRLDFEVDFSHTGTHYVWVRGLGPSYSDDSLHMGLDGVGLASADQIGGFSTDWRWSNYTRDSVVATLYVPSTGVHTVNVWMREDGFIIDKIVLSTNENYTPSGDGPPESSRGDSPLTPVIDAISPSSGVTGEAVTITGSRFGSVQGSGYVMFHDAVEATGISSWGDTEIVCTVPDGAQTGCVTVTTDQGTSSCFSYQVVTQGDGPFQQDPGDDGIVSMEAEHYDANTPQGDHVWTEANPPPAGYLGGGAMEAWPNDGTGYYSGYESTSPRLDFEVDFSHTGTHYVWVRGLGPSYSDDSLHMGLDGVGLASADKIGGFSTDWRWSNYTRDSVVATLYVPSTGVHTVNVWMREDGFIIDKIVLSTSENYTPSGDGPPESQRGTP